MYETNKEKSNKKSTEQADCMKIAKKVIFTQISATVGFKNIGDVAVIVTIKELEKLYEGAVS